MISCASTKTVYLQVQPQKVSNELLTEPCTLIAPDSADKREFLRVLVVNNECSALNYNKLLSWQEYYKLLIDSAQTQNINKELP